MFECRCENGELIKWLAAVMCVAIVGCTVAPVIVSSDIYWVGKNRGWWKGHPYLDKFFDYAGVGSGIVTITKCGAIGVKKVAEKVGTKAIAKIAGRMVAGLAGGPIGWTLDGITIASS